VKQDLTKLSDVGQWTKVTQAAANTYTDLTSAEQAALWAIEFKQRTSTSPTATTASARRSNDVGTTTHPQRAACCILLSTRLSGPRRRHAVGVAD
jgi:hypothetical protein